MRFEKCYLSSACVILMTDSFAVNPTFNQTVCKCSTVEVQIGGVGEIVKIDECKIDRRTYERGRGVEVS